MNDLAIKRAEKSLSDFLEENPHLAETQAELEAQMDKLGVDATSRMCVIAHNMRWNLKLLADKCLEVKALLEKIK